MTRNSWLVEFSTPNPLIRSGGVTMWQVRCISNSAQPCVSIRRWSCARTSRQNSVRMGGMGSDASPWYAPNSATSFRADPFICNIRADGENTIMPESGNGKMGWREEAPRGRASSGPARPSWSEWIGLFLNDSGTRVLSGKCSWTVQELHLWQGCRKRDYPANTDHNVMSGIRQRTKTVSSWRKLNQLLLANQQANGGSLESIFLADLVLEKAEVGGRDVVRVTDK